MILTLKEIGPDRHIHKFEHADGTKENVKVTKAVWNLKSTPTLEGAVWISSCIKIGFKTPLRILPKDCYATQLNGHHWVKLDGCRMIKVKPGAIVDGVMSDERADKIRAKYGSNQ